MKGAIKRKLSDVCTIIAGQSPESKYYNQDGIGLPFFQGKADFGDLYPTIRTYCSTPTKIAQKNDILLSVRAPVGATNLAPTKVCIGRGLTAIRPDDCLSTKYLLLFFRYFQAELAQKGTGTTFNAITQTVVKNIEIPVPSISAQERLVSKIEELFSEIDNAISSLKTAKRKLEIYRSAVLKHAFSNSDKWEKLSLGELMKEVRNGCGTKPSDSGNYKILTIGSVRAMKVSIDEHRYNDKPFDEKDRIHENDLLFTRYNGSREFVGVCGVVPRLSESYAYPDKLIRFTPKINNSIHSKYIQFYVSHGKARRYIRSKIKTSSGQNGIAGSDLKKTEIYLPSLQEQKRIVENIELRFGVYEDIDCTISCALRRAESLKQSILKKAFEGELL